MYQDEIKSKIETCVLNIQKCNEWWNYFGFLWCNNFVLWIRESEDDLRHIGFSKKVKYARPQIQLGIVWHTRGYPLSFEVYEGNKYEGHTLIDVLKSFKINLN